MSISASAIHGPAQTATLASSTASLIPGVTVHKDTDRGLVVISASVRGSPQAPTSSMKAKRKDRVPGKGAVKILPDFMEVTMVTQRLKPQWKEMITEFARAEPLQ